MLKLLAVNTDKIDITSNVDLATNLSGLTPSRFISAGINMLLGIAGIVSFIFLLWGGIQWILAGGDKEGTEKARKRITNALIGLAIVFSAYALIYIIRVLFNVDILQVELKPL